MGRLRRLTFVNQIGLFAESWRREPPGGPVVALGSSDAGTGSPDRSVGGKNATVRRIRAFPSRRGPFKESKNGCESEVSPQVDGEARQEAGAPQGRRCPQALGQEDGEEEVVAVRSAST